MPAKAHYLHGDSAATLCYAFASGIFKCCPYKRNRIYTGMIIKAFILKRCDALYEFIRYIFIVRETPLPIRRDGRIQQVTIFVFNNKTGRRIE